MPERRRPVSFWPLCYDEPTWQQTRETAVHKLGLPSEGPAAVQALVRECHEPAARTEQGLASNPFARLAGGQRRFHREPRHSAPTGTVALRQLLRRDLTRVRMEQLLMDVDAHCGFSRHLVPPLADPAHGEGDAARLLTPAQHYSALLAALVAQGTNLGIWAMATSPEDLTVRMLQHVSRTGLREETMRRANAALVHYHRSLALSRCWGEGQIASADGQRFGVRESSLLAAFYPRYCGYYDRVVSVYTHLSDPYSGFSPQGISCAEREALSVLDGLLENETA